MGTATLLAEAWRYPVPGLLESLEQASLNTPVGPIRNAFSAFLSQVKALSLSDWEELYTHTWDLNPVAAPYIGYQVWGDAYPRGNFMASINRRLFEAGIDLRGELPDHLTPALLCLDACQPPPEKLMETLQTALQKIRAALVKADPTNPYLSLLDATQAVMN